MTQIVRAQLVSGCPLVAIYKSAVYKVEPWEELKEAQYQTGERREVTLDTLFSSKLGIRTLDAFLRMCKDVRMKLCC